MSRDNYRVKRFIKDFTDVKIEDFYQLPNTENEKVAITFKIENLRLVNVSIKYIKTTKCRSFKTLFPTIDLPLELVNHITGYLPDIININLNVIIPEHYPFNPHVWEIVSAKNSKKSGEMIFYDIINKHNCYNTGDWSPAMSLEKDILCLIEKLYDYLYGDL